MNTQSNSIPESHATSQAMAAADISTARRLQWSVRRELWEYRSLYLGPLIVAGLILGTFLIDLFHFPADFHASTSKLGALQQIDFIQRPYLFTALLLMGAALIVSVFYCLDTLQSERRDRSILFWKSVPVSDLTTVLAKASIPIVVLPLITFAITALTQGVIFLLSTARLAGSGNVGLLWSHVPLLQIWTMEFFHLLAFHGFWYAPFYGWLLLASAWSRRAALLWAVLPPFAIGMLEKFVLHSTHFALMLQHRFMGDPGAGAPKSGRAIMDLLMPVTPGQLLISPGLWVGLTITAVFLAVAVRLRRYREPN